MIFDQFLKTATGLTGSDPDHATDQEQTAPRLTNEERALVQRVVADGLKIQPKFKPEPLYKNTGKGHYESGTVEEIQKARKRARPEN